MLISKKWLQSYFEVELPSMQKIADTLLLHSFEIEGLEEVEDDWVLDIDVLPNRAHDCLCHEGVANELAGLLNLTLKEKRYSNIGDVKTIDKKISVVIENKNQCLRYVGTLVKNIEVRESPDWLRSRLTSMGQKSINSLVDATNYVMFDMGQPMHVFDADKVSGGIIIRNAKVGEKITILSGEEVELLETDLLICDEEKILALAGVKGGNSAEVTSETNNIIIESANFNPLTTRKTARRVKILTDASKRYENEITSEKAIYASRAMLSLILELAATENTLVGNNNGTKVTDNYPNPEEQFELEFTQEHTARLLGFEIKESEINKILEQFDYSYIVDDGNYKVTIPFERLDLRIPEDMIEEIGRLYGYHNIPVASVDNLEFKSEINKSFYVVQKLRNYFVENGFTEIMNYTFVNKGNIELFNPMASDKKALRKNLSTQMKSSLEKNSKLADFVNVEQVLNFEIDVVHTKQGEETHCCFGLDTLSKKSRKKYGDENSQIEKHVKQIAEMFGLDELNFVRDGDVVSFNIKQCELGAGSSYGELLLDTSYGQEARFRGISIYPYVKRDISFWIESSDAVKLEKAILCSGAEYLQKVFLFDEFEKEGKTSFAFSMIFQSFVKTLTDKEVDMDMEKINTTIKNLDGEIR